MKLKVVVAEDFFQTPYQVRGDILKCPMDNVEAPDKVTYPGIVLLSDSIKDLVAENIYQVLGYRVGEALTFARHTFADMEPPNWAHSDKEMGDYTALIYMNEKPEYIDDGTFLVRHKKTGMSTHPTTAKGVKTLLNDSNKRSKWVITDHLKASFNRCVILNSDFLHAAGQGYGLHRGDSRLVLTSFFRL